MSEGTTCYERDETLCEDQMCVRTGCRLRNERLARSFTDLEKLRETVAKIDHLLEREEHDSGYAAFIYMRKIWPQLKGCVDAAQAEQKPPHLTLQNMAETIHKARWPVDRQTEITPFEDEDRNGREYCFRIAAAVIASHGGGKGEAVAWLLTWPDGETAVYRENPQLHPSIRVQALYAAPQPPANAGGTEATLKMVAGLFAESVHETYTREEVVSIVEDMMRIGRPTSSIPSTHENTAQAELTAKEPGELTDASGGRDVPQQVGTPAVSSTDKSGAA